MKNAVWFFFVTCAAVCAQNSSDNAAAGALKNRLQTLNLLSPPRAIRLVRPAVVAPTICAIPLLNVRPPGTADKMHVVTPPNSAASSRGDTVQVPAPACGEALFTNK